MKLALDIGNTTISAALFHNHDICQTQTFYHQHKDIIALEPLAKKADHVLAAAVAPAVLETTVDVLRTLGCAPKVLDAVDIPIRTNTVVHSGTGVDRLLNALCAVREYACPAVIIDCGSAVTVDIVDNDGCFCGGAIFPGIRAMTRSLSHETEKLPEINPCPSEMPGKNTVEAISCGILNGSAGMIDRLIREAEAFLKTPATLILTGGGATSMRPLLNTENLHLDSHLTLKGIIHAAG